MGTDEQAIRELIGFWHSSTVAGNIDDVLPLMTDDVVFLGAGQAPFGQDAFAKNLRALMQTHRIESSARIHEIQVSGNLAYCWSHLDVRIIPLGDGTPAERAGPALSVFRKQEGGTWQLARDANMLAPVC